MSGRAIFRHLESNISNAVLYFSQFRITVNVKKHPCLLILCLLDFETFFYWTLLILYSKHQILSSFECQSIRGLTLSIKQFLLYHKYWFYYKYSIIILISLDWLERPMFLIHSCTEIIAILIQNSKNMKEVNFMEKKIRLRIINIHF